MNAGFLDRILNLKALGTCGYYLLILTLPLVLEPWGLIHLPTGNRLALPLLVVPFSFGGSLVFILSKRSRIRDSYLLPLILILGGYLWGILANDVSFRGVELFIKAMLLTGLSLSIALLAPSLRAAQIGIFYIALAVAVMVLSELLGILAGEIRLVNIMRGLRGPSATAYALLVLTPFPLIAATSSSSRMSRLVMGSLAILLITGLFYTYSRGGTVALVVGLFTAVLLAPRTSHGRKHLLWGLIIVVLVDLLLFMTAPSLLKGELASSLDVSSNLNRLVLLKAGLRIIRAHPLSGIGLGRFDDVHPEYITGEEASLLAHPAYSSSHNQYVHIWNEGGLIAFMGFIWLLVNLFRELRAAQVIDTQPLLLACIGLWAGSIWFFLTETPANLEIFWGALGITLAGLRFSKPKAE